ncbi:MAG: hypothetical protein AB7G80_04275 [Dongiaceae bacterium]
MRSLQFPDSLTPPVRNLKPVLWVLLTLFLFLMTFFIYMNAHAVFQKQQAARKKLEHVSGNSLTADRAPGHAPLAGGAMPFDSRRDAREDLPVDQSAIERLALALPPGFGAVAKGVNRVEVNVASDQFFSANEVSLDKQGILLMPKLAEIMLANPNRGLLLEVRIGVAAAEDPAQTGLARQRAAALAREFLNRGVGIGDIASGLDVGREGRTRFLLTIDRGRL